MRARRRVAASFLIAACRGPESSRARTTAAEPTETPATDRDAFARGFESDAGVSRCPVRPLPPATLSTSLDASSTAAIATDGVSWGIAWSESPDGRSAVFFARTGADGRVASSVVRLSERDHHASEPALVWAGDHWLVGWHGGAAVHDEIWLARVGADGRAQGRPHRITARDRDDRGAGLAATSDGIVLAFTSGPDGGMRYEVRTVWLDAWGSQQAPGTIVADRSSPVAGVRIARDDEGVVASWATGRNDRLAIEVERLDARGFPRTGARVIGRGALGPRGASVTAWPGHHVFAWDEVRDGAPAVDTLATGRRLEANAAVRPLPTGPAGARAPDVASLDDDTWLAWEIEPGRQHAVQLGLLDRDGTIRGEPVTVRGYDGDARDPHVVALPSALGAVTRSATGLSFHAVRYGPCTNTR